jgi:hypothetical protein
VKVTNTDLNALGCGSGKEVSRSSSIGSEAPSASVSLYDRKHTTVASSCRGGGAKRRGGKEGISSALAPLWKSHLPSVWNLSGWRHES